VPRPRRKPAPVAHVTDEQTEITPAPEGSYDAPLAVLDLPEHMPKQREQAEALVWSGFLQDNHARFQRTIGRPIGHMLGCGRFGCVYASKAPWIVKITHDKSEGPVWAYIGDLLRNRKLSRRLHALLRVHDVVRIRPDVLFDRKLQPVFGIVREEAEPVLVRTSRPGWPQDTEPAISMETARHLGLTPEMLSEAGLAREGQRPFLNEIAKLIERSPGIFPKPVKARFVLLYQALRDVRQYKGLAQDFFKENLPPVQAAAGMQAAAAMLLANDIAAELGETLDTCLLPAVQLIFQDLHLYNLGWRTRETIEGDKRPKCMVILDPGLAPTPYMPEIRESELLANMGAYLRNAGLIDDEPSFPRRSSRSAYR
jgi:hypothetical protein